MREIKFRMWSTKEKKLHTHTKWLYTHFYNCMLKESYKLMQYIGKKDKNGVKIYEGDIVIFRDKEKFVVEYNNERAEYRAFYYKIEDRDIYTERLISDRCEVIGNIYEYPNLLEE